MALPNFSDDIEDELALLEEKNSPVFNKPQDDKTQDDKPKDNKPQDISIEGLTIDGLLEDDLVLPISKTTSNITTNTNIITNTNTNVDTNSNIGTKTNVNANVDTNGNSVNSVFDPTVGFSLQDTGGIKKETENNTDDKFVDEENKKLFAYGKRPKDVPKQDSRVDINKKIKLTRNIILATCVIIVGLGAKGVFFPSGQLTQTDVETIISNQLGNKDFPKDRGESFAKKFLIDYLTIKKDDDNSVLLQNYGEAIATRNPSGDFEQSIIGDPSLVEYRNFSAQSARYVFTVGTKTNVLDDKNQPIINWLSYSVNVYYNTHTGGFNVAAGSPTVVPTIKVQDVRKVPLSINLSEDGKTPPDKALTEKVATTVKQFMREYLKATSTNTSALEQYLVPNPDPSLLDGLGNSMVLDSEDAISVNAYPNSGGVVKTEVTVRLKPNVSNNGGYVNVSKYALTLRELSGKYLVEKMVPLGYLPVE